MPARFSPEARSRLIDTITREVRPRFARLGDKWQSAAAEAIGVDQSTISRLMGPTPSGGSLELVDKVAAYLNIEPATIISGRNLGDSPRFRDLPGFADAMAVARARVREEHRGIEEWALEKAADMASRPPVTEVTAEILVGYAAVLARDPELIKRHAKA